MAANRRVAVLVVLAAAVALACEDTVSRRLQTGSEATLINLEGIAYDDAVVACLTVNDGRPVDWYFTTQQAGRQWMENARNHYARVASNQLQPYRSPPSRVLQSRRDTIGFEDWRFTIRKDQGDDPNDAFAVIIHGKAECFQYPGGCVIAASTARDTRLAAWAISALVILVLAICGAVAIAVVWCCRRRSATMRREQSHGQDVQQPPGCTSGAEHQQHGGAEGWYAPQPGPGASGQASPQEQQPGSTGYTYPSAHPTVHGGNSASPQHADDV